jgi:hypothetical protein
MDQELGYYRRRASEERRAAGQATHDKVRKCHSELAAAYDLRVRDLKARQRRMELHLVSPA